jgi:hypothetical protein
MNSLCRNIQKLILNDLSSNNISKLKHTTLNKHMLSILIDIEQIIAPYLITSSGNSNKLDLWYSHSEKENYFDLKGIVAIDILGNRIIIGTCQGDIYELNIKTNDLQYRFSAEGWGLVYVCLLAANKLVTATRSTLKVWDMYSGIYLIDCNERECITNIVKYLPSGFFVTAGNTIKLYDINSDGPLRVFLDDKILHLLVFNNDIFITANDKITIKIWSIDCSLAKRNLSWGHLKKIQNLVKLNETHFLSLSLDQTIILWDINGEMFFKFECLYKDNKFATVLDNRLLITSNGLAKINVLNLMTFKSFDILLRDSCTSLIGINQDTICFSDYEKFYIRNIYDKQSFLEAAGVIKGIININDNNYLVYSEVKVEGLTLQTFNKQLKMFTNSFTLLHVCEYEIFVTKMKTIIVDYRSKQCYTYNLKTSKLIRKVRFPFKNRITSTYLISEDQIIVMMKDLLIFNLAKNTIEYRLTNFTDLFKQHFNKVNGYSDSDNSLSHDSDSDRGIYSHNDSDSDNSGVENHYYYRNLEKDKNFKIDRDKYIIQRKNSLMLTDLKTCLKLIKIKDVTNILIKDKLVYIGSGFDMIIYDLNLQEVGRYEMNEWIGRVVGMGKERVIILSASYLSFWNSKDFNCVNFIKYVNTNGVLAYMG